MNWRCLVCGLNIQYQCLLCKDHVGARLGYRDGKLYWILANNKGMRTLNDSAQVLVLQLPWEYINYVLWRGENPEKYKDLLKGLAYSDDVKERP